MRCFSPYVCRTFFLSDERKVEMCSNSFNLSLEFTPERGATYFYERVKELMQN